MVYFFLNPNFNYCIVFRNYLAQFSLNIVPWIYSHNKYTYVSLSVQTQKNHFLYFVCTVHYYTKYSTDSSYYFYLYLLYSKQNFADVHADVISMRLRGNAYLLIFSKIYVRKSKLQMMHTGTVPYSTFKKKAKK